MGLLRRLRTWFDTLRPGYPWPAVDITLPGGRYLHLVGSIHMGTADMAPLPARLVEKLRRADALIVEADIRGDSSPFGDQPPCPPLGERLDEALFLQLEKLIDDLALPLSRLDTLPLWQVALILQAHQAQRLGLRPDFGIDYQLLNAAQTHQVKVSELEGAQSQVELLRRLPQDGLALLEDTLTHWHTNARLLQSMMGWWMARPPEAAGSVALPNTFSAELGDMLMQQRNRQWHHYLLSLPPGRYVVAVGALHLYGEDNLPAMFRAS
ncbi:TraB/GumN family protein [Cronobacter sakazakii]|uniref:TraB/GumN family protein n=1 Tax=Cronobacter sakazakii TaxID=28141 RepID=UPI000CFBF32D|nr:TraB/GumN family protein [Cronobacter sakazakii]